MINRVYRRQENILISDSLSACISDYGLMSPSQLITQRGTGMLGGQSNGCDKKSEAQDIYAFSTVLYEVSSLLPSPLPRFLAIDA